MEGIYVFILIILIIALVSIFFFVWQMNIGTRKNAGQLKANLETAQSYISVRMSITNFLQSVISFFRVSSHRPT